MKEERIEDKLSFLFKKKIFSDGEDSLQVFRRFLDLTPESKKTSKDLKDKIKNMILNINQHHPRANDVLDFCFSIVEEYDQIPMKKMILFYRMLESHQNLDDCLVIPEDALVVVAPTKLSDDVDGFIRKLNQKRKILSISPYLIEFSDDPNSPEAKRGSIDRLRQVIIEHLKKREPLYIDGRRIKDNHLNEIRKMAVDFEIKGIRIDITPEIFNKEVIWQEPSCRRTWDYGKFDIIGDVHGCYGELILLLEKAGYQITQNGNSVFSISHPEGRRLIFLGDLADRGPENLKVFKFVMDIHYTSGALMVKGNHDIKTQGWLSRARAGKRDNVNDQGGFAKTREELKKAPEIWQPLNDFLENVPSHYLLDEGRLVVCHAGILEDMLGRDNHRILNFCLYGSTTGEMDENGLPIREDWAKDYHGKTLVVHGHTPYPEVTWNQQGNVCCIDTGCPFGGKLTMLRWPEMSYLYQNALRQYAVNPGIPIEENKGFSL